MGQMMELREILEETIASLAAVRASPEDLDEMEAALADMEGDPADPKTMEADLRFHRALAKSAHNHYFEMVTRTPHRCVSPADHADQQLHGGGSAASRHTGGDPQRGNPVSARQAVRRLMRRTMADTKNALKIIESPTPVSI